MARAHQYLDMYIGPSHAESPLTYKEAMETNNRGITLTVGLVVPGRPEDHKEAR